MASALSPSLQLSSGLSCAPLPATLRHQAQRLQGLPRPEHGEGQVAGFSKTQKGKDKAGFVSVLVKNK